MESWYMIYTGPPNGILVDQGSEFGDQFVAFGKLSKINVSNTGVESRNELGIGVSYHNPLRTWYWKLKLTSTQLKREIVLAVNVKAMNDTIGPEGIVPSSIVFGGVSVNKNCRRRQNPSTLASCSCNSCSKSSTRNGDHNVISVNKYFPAIF